MSRTVMFDTVLRGCTATYTVAPPNNGWYVDRTPWKREGGNHIYQQDTIDIGGMTTTQEETFFPQAATVQNSPFYIAPGCILRDPADPQSGLAPYGALFQQDGFVKIALIDKPHVRGSSATGAVGTVTVTTT